MTPPRLWMKRRRQQKSRGCKQIQIPTHQELCLWFWDKTRYDNRLDHHAQVHFGPGNNQDHRLEAPTCRRDAQLLTGRMVMPQRSQKESTQIKSNLRFDDELTQRAPATDDGCSSPDLVGRVG